MIDQINKRLTLNLLIQGAAQHAFLTSHHLIRDELNAINPKLLLFYDRFALAGFVQYWQLFSTPFYGAPAIFWRRTRFWPHPFRHHALLSRHGLQLSRAARLRAFERCREKRVTRIPGLFEFQSIYFLNRLNTYEIDHNSQLVALAKRTTSMVWGIDESRLDARISVWVSFGKIPFPRSPKAAILRLCAAGYGGVLTRDDNIKVVARGRNWPILSHELVKGTVELICLHGLNDLDDETYRRVLRVADRPEFEPWLLQTGADLWRRLLPLLPDGVPVAHIVMRLAQLAPQPLEQTMLAVIEEPESARNLLASLA